MHLQSVLKRQAELRSVSGYVPTSVRLRHRNNGFCSARAATEIKLKPLVAGELRYKQPVPACCLSHHELTLWWRSFIGNNPSLNHHHDAALYHLDGHAKLCQLPQIFLCWVEAGGT